MLQSAPFSSKILIVEDNSMTRKLYEQMTKDSKHLFDFAEDGLRALHKLAKNHYDLVVSDIEMPNCDGFKLRKAILAHENNTIRHIKFIFASAQETENIREQLTQSTCDDYLKKPFLKQEFFSMIQRVLENDKATIANLAALNINEVKTPNEKKKGTEIVDDYVQKKPISS